MKLSLPFFEKKENVSYFLVLVLRHNKANAVIFEESQGSAKIVNSHSEDFLTSIEDANDEELLSVLDKTISRAESVLPSNVETQKTIFGLKQNWIEDNKIKKPYLEKLKRISDELGLVPVGFLITTEAIIHLLAKDEGAPVSAVLAEIDKNYVCASLIRAGKIIEVKDSPLETDAVTTVDNLLKHFENAEVLPSRVIIFNGAKDFSQQFISHSWSKTLPFLHLPQITNLESGLDARAVLAGAATEMGFSVLADTPSANTRKTFEPKNENLEKIDMGHPEEEKKTEEITKEEYNTEKNESSEYITDELPHEISEEASADFFGFVKNKDVAKEQQIINEDKIIDNFKEVPSEVISEEIEQLPQEHQFESSEKNSLPANAALILTSAKKTLKTLIESLSKTSSALPGLKSLPIQGNKIILLPAGISLLFIFLFIYYSTGRNANITLDIETKKITQQKDVVFSASDTTDISQNIIAAKFVEITENGSTSIIPTGNKDIGTPAKGTVTVFNNNNNSITLSSGTKITSSNDLLFTLDKSVTIASASGDDFTGTTPGKADATVTAAEIGTNYNLPSNTKFTTSQNSVVAKNDNAFSGGTKKSITVFSKEDAEKLETDLIKNLESKAKDNIVNKIPDNNILLPIFISKEASNQDFSKKIGDEATNVTLKADVIYKSIYYSKSDMATFAKGILSIPNDLSIDENNILADASDLETTDDHVSTTLDISAFLIPKIDQVELAKKIDGKSISEAKKILEQIPQVSNAFIEISPNLPLFTGSLPNFSKIKFSINTNE